MHARLGWFQGRKAADLEFELVAWKEALGQAGCIAWDSAYDVHDSFGGLDCRYPDTHDYKRKYVSRALFSSEYSTMSHLKRLL